MDKFGEISKAREFAKRIIPALAILGLVAGMASQLVNYDLTERIKQEQRYLVDRERQVLMTRLSAPVSDVLLVADQVRAQLEAPSQTPNGPGCLVRLFTNLIRHHHDYFQVRYLDSTGREAVRVDRREERVVVVPEDKLQDKSGHEYFQAASQIPAGKVFMSRFDLNRENGMVEVPYRPTLRFVAPVYGTDGGFLGAVIINFNGKPLLQRLIGSGPLGTSVPMMADSRGYWLLAPPRGREWSFMFPDDEPDKVADRFPGLARTMAQRHEGQLRTSRGLFTYVMVNCPLISAHPVNEAPRVESRDRWWIISLVPDNGLVSPAARWIHVTTAVFAVGLAVLMWVWAENKVQAALAERALEESRASMLALGESSQDALIMINSEGNIILWNPAATRMLGYSRDEAMGSPLHDLVATEEEQGLASRGLEGFRRTGEGPIVGGIREIQGRHKDGHLVPLELAVSSTRVEGQWMAVGSLRDITERKQYEERLKQLATTDPLTGLANRRHFMETAEMEYQKSLRYHHPLSVVMMDIDFFKKVNDTYGHAAGDEVLKALAAKTLETARQVDLVGRFGGEEFALLMPATDEEGAARFAERLRLAIADMPVTADDEVIKVTVSQGVAQMLPETKGIEELLGRADEALYAAKEGGRNRVEVHPGS